MRLAVLGDVIIDVVTSETIKESADITSNPVEHGINVSDHMSIDPIEVQITGAFTQEDGWKKLHQIRKYQRDKQMVRYVGRNILNNMIVKDISRDHHGGNKFGADFTLTLVEVRISSARRFGSSVIGKKLQSQTSKRISQGRQEVRNK